MNERRANLLLFLGLVLALVVPLPAAAQEYQLFDRFALTFGGSWAQIDTKLRLDSKDLGIGTEIDFEELFGLDQTQFVPSLLFEWQIASRHRLFASWYELKRDGSDTIAFEIQWGDLVIPAQATLAAQQDLADLRVGYVYYPWRRDRWAFGVGGGLRVVDLFSSLRVTALAGDSDEIEVGASESADVTGPLPFLSLDYRYGIAPNWRLTSALGLFYLAVGDFEGSQIILDAGIEHLPFDRFGWGVAFSGALVDVDVDSSDWAGAARLDLVTGRVFVKARW